MAYMTLSEKFAAALAAGSPAAAQASVPAQAAPAPVAPVAPVAQKPVPLLVPTTDHFMTTCSPALAETIAAAAWIALDLETTHLTKHSKPLEITGSTKIGPDTSISKILGRGRYGDCDPTPRMRVVSVGLPDGQALAFDIDKIVAEGRARLLSACCTCPVWVGQNLGFDLAWFYSAGYSPTPFIVDLMLAIRTLNPSFIHHIAKLAGKIACADKDEQVVQRACYTHQAALANAGKTSTISFSLETLTLAYAAAIGKPVPVDKSWQKPQNWMLPDLLPDQYTYCVGDITLPGKIMQKAFGCKSMSAIIARLKGHPLYPSLSAATIALSKMHKNGLPVSAEGMAELAEGERGRIQSALQVLAGQPLFAEHLAAVADEGKTESAAIKDAVAAYCTTRLGITLGTSKDGKPAVGEDALILLGVHHDPVINAILDIREAKKRLGLIAAWRALSASDGRLHGLVTQGAGTGRTTASEPNIQQLPRDPIFRGPDSGIFRARQGHKIIATDYSAIEMRIAAALALRALREYQDGDFGTMYAGQKAVALKKRIEALAAEFAGLETIPDYQPQEKDFDGYALHHLAWFLSRVRRTGVESRLAEGFRNGIDPHLLTAVGVNKRSGTIDPLAYITGKSVEERDALKKELKGPRQAAKPVNFGLLYGMQPKTLWENGITDYGLRWTLEEATAAKTAWFDMYPELGFWHTWSKLVYRTWATAEWCALGYGGDGIEVKSPSKKPVLTPKTLTNRPLYVCTPQQLLNFQDQGAGADIAMTALSKMGYLVDYLVCFVHDEFVLEVPEAMAEQARQDLERAMIDAAACLGLVPAEVESAVGDWWIH